MVRNKAVLLKELLPNFENRILDILPSYAISIVAPGNTELFLPYCLTPCFLESVFCQELEKTGFRFARNRESNEIHLFLYRTHLIFEFDMEKTSSKHKVLRRV